MFDHVTIRASDREASERFYLTVLPTLGIDLTHSGELGPEWNDFSLAQADAENPPTQRLHIGFVAPSRAHVDEFWRVGTEAGYRDDGAPGPRPQYSDDYYGAFLLDPDGNSAEAVHHGGCARAQRRPPLDPRRRPRGVDAVLRDGGAGGRVPSGRELPGRTMFACLSGSFSVVANGHPTQHVHIAFSATDNETVDRFHREAIAAGYRDNGAPGERTIYHEGYYGAFVLDPDGNNIEVVNHNR